MSWLWTKSWPAAWLLAQEEAEEPASGLAWVLLIGLFCLAYFVIKGGPRK